MERAWLREIWKDLEREEAMLMVQRIGLIFVAKFDGDVDFSMGSGGSAPADAPG